MEGALDLRAESLRKHGEETVAELQDRSHSRGPRWLLPRNVFAHDLAIVDHEPYLSYPAT